MVIKVLRILGVLNRASSKVKLLGRGFFNANKMLPRIIYSEYSGPKKELVGLI